jgi:predicted ArsR family transcriptional regulator
MAVRQHLYALEDEGAVAFTEEPRAVGRPAKLWRVTSQADRHFSDSHAELAVGLLDAMEEAFGQQGVERMLLARARQQTEAYGKRVPARASLPERVDALASIRSEEGYLADVERLDDGSLLLVETHCPIAAAANRCRGLCSSELGVFRAVLGPAVTVERTEHIVSGERRCAYRVSEAVGTKPGRPARVRA